MSKILITSYKDPDTDGTACMIAYEEFLQKKGIEVKAGIFGRPHKEAEFIFDEFSIPRITSGKLLIDKCEMVILVDASDTEGTSEKINPKDVIEIIDHREIHEAEKFPEAQVQIESVGAAATLITEKYIHDQVDISRDSAVFLYAAIISNTVNFQNNITTDRDRQAAAWLQEKVSISDDLVRQMFQAKSHIDSLDEAMDQEYAAFEMGDKKVGVVQLEIMDVEKFVAERRGEIDGCLARLKNENSLDLILLTLIDVDKASNDFIIIDEYSMEIAAKALAIDFQDGLAHQEGIVMRKEIVPKLKNILENN